MEHVAKLAAAGLMQAQKSSVISKTPTTQARLSDGHVDQLFVEMNAIYGHRWRSNFTTGESVEAAKAVWAEQLGGLTRRQLRTGIELNAKLADWNPSVSEFLRAACGLPSLESCIERVKRGSNNDPVSYRISSMIGQYEMRTLSYFQLSKRVNGLYQDIYQSELSRAIGSDVSFVPAGAIAKQAVEESGNEPTYVSDEEAKPHFAKMKEALKGAR